MNEITEYRNTSLSVWENEVTIQEIKEIFGKTLSAQEFKMLVNMGKSTGLNPFLREIWCVKYGDSPASIFIGRDGYRRSAQSDPNYDYHSIDCVYSNDNYQMVNGEVVHKYNLSDRGFLIGAYCSVKRKNSSKPITVFVSFKEYNTGKAEWAKKPETMIKKVSEAQALRMAFQALFSNTYDESEQYNIEETANKRTILVDDANKKLGITTKLIDNFEVTFQNCNTLEELKSCFDLLKKEYKDTKNLSELLKAKDKRKQQIESMVILDNNFVELSEQNTQWLGEFSSQNKE
jgi:phage recombination protein Bet